MLFKLMFRFNLKKALCFNSNISNYSLNTAQSFNELYCALIWFVELKACLSCIWMADKKNIKCLLVLQVDNSGFKQLKALMSFNSVYWTGSSQHSEFDCLFMHIFFCS